MALETGGFQVRRLPDYQPMDPRLFVEQPMDIGGIIREGTEGFTRGRQMAADDEVRQARLAQLEQQMAQQEQGFVADQQQAQARLAGMEQQSRLGELQLQEAERQHAMVEEGRRTLSEILEEGSGEEFEGFEDEAKEQIFNTARMAQVIDGTTGIPSLETFRAVSQAQFERSSKKDLHNLVPTQGQEFGEDGTYIDPVARKPYVQVDGQMFDARRLDPSADPAQREMLGRRTGVAQVDPETGEETQPIVDLPTEARRSARQARDIIMRGEDAVSSQEWDSAVQILGRLEDIYGRESIEHAGIILPEEEKVQIRFSPEEVFDSPEQRRRFTNLPREAQQKVRDTWRAEGRDREKAMEVIEREEKHESLLQEMRELETEKEQNMRITSRLPEGIGAARGFQSLAGAALGAAERLPGIERRRTRTVEQIDDDIARVQRQINELDAQDTVLETDTEIEDGETRIEQSIDDFMRDFGYRHQGPTEVPTD